MCETKFKLEDLRSNSPSFCEDIVDGFAFASFVCEDDLKKYSLRQQAARQPPPGDVNSAGDECLLSSLSRNASSLSHQFSVYQLEPVTVRSNGPGSSGGAKTALVCWRSGDGSVVVDATALKNTCGIDKDPSSSKKSKKSISATAAAFGCSEENSSNKVLSGSECTVDTPAANNGISLLLAAAESEDGNCHNASLTTGAGDVKIIKDEVEYLPDQPLDSSNDTATELQTAGREAGTDGHGQQQRRQPGGGDACSPTLPIHSSPAVRQQQQPSASSSSTSSSSLLQPMPPLIDVKAVAASSQVPVVGVQAGSSNVTGLTSSSSRRSPPPPGRTEFTKPVAVVSGSRIDDVEKKNAQSTAGVHGSVSPRVHHQSPLFPTANRSPTPRRLSSPSSALRQMSGTPGPHSRPPFGYPQYGTASPYMYPSPYSSLVSPLGLSSYKPPGLPLRPGYPDALNPSALQSAELCEAQHRLNERFLQDRVRAGSPSSLSPFLGSLDLLQQQQLRQLSAGASGLFPHGVPSLDKVMEYERAIRQQQLPGYLPVLPPMDMSLNRVGGTGLDLSGGRVPGSLNGAFQPKAVPPYGPFDPLYVSRKEQDKPTSALPPELRKRGRWCAAHVQIAFQIHIAKQCARLEGREKPDRWNSSSIDLLRTPGRSDFMKPRELSDPLRPVVHTADGMRTPSHGDVFKIPSALAALSVDPLRSSGQAARELDRLRSSADFLRGADDIARSASQAELLRSVSLADAWSQQSDMYNRSLSYLMSLRPGDMGLPQALQARAALDAATAYRNAGSLFGPTPPPSTAGSSPYAYPPSLGVGSLGAFGAYKDGLSRSGLPNRSTDSFAEYLYRSQLMTGGQTSEHKERTGSDSSRLRELEHSGSKEQERQRDADAKSSHHLLHSSQSSHSSSRHGDDRDRHRSRSPVRQDHRSSVERRELNSPTVRHSHKPMHHSQSTDMTQKTTAYSGGSSSSHDRDIKDSSSRYSLSNRPPDNYSSSSNHGGNSSKVPSSSSHDRTHSSGHDRRSSSNDNGNTRIHSSKMSSSHQSRPQHSSGHDSSSSRLAVKPTEHSRSRSRSPSRSSSDITRQHSSDRSRHTHEHSSSSSHRHHVFASGDQQRHNTLHPASHSAESDRSLFHHPALHLPSPSSSMPDAYRAMFGLPDFYSASAAMPPVPKANLLLPPRDASVEAMALMGHLNPANFGRLPT